MINVSYLDKKKSRYLSFPIIINSISLVFNIFSNEYYWTEKNELHWLMILVGMKTIRLNGNH